VVTRSKQGFKRLSEVILAVVDGKPNALAVAPLSFSHLLFHPATMAVCSTRTADGHNFPSVAKVSPGDVNMAFMAVRPANLAGHRGIDEPGRAPMAR
jgi:hypothetical protein